MLSGDLRLARGHYADAMADFKRAELDTATRARGYPGEGIALSLLGRSDEAFAILQRAVTEDPSAWRAWNALAGEYDNRRESTPAEAAYDHAFTDSSGAAVVLNNRGYSRLLQGRVDEGVADFVDALKKKPDFAEARTNLRLGLAMKGDYTRAVSGGSPQDQARRCSTMRASRPPCAVITPRRKTCSIRP